MTASGIRVGTPSVTTQGMKEPEMALVAGLIARAVRASAETVAGRAVLAGVAAEVGDLVDAFPAYPMAGDPVPA
jgi:glycine hydroxymethyltransferase